MLKHELRRRFTPAVSESRLQPIFPRRTPPPKKRDLCTLLERPINLSDSGDEFMLYNLNDTERVPIQDLTAYFQLYHQNPGDPDLGNQGLRYASDPHASGIQIPSPDYGGWKTEDKFQRQYTSL